MVPRSYTHTLVLKKTPPQKKMHSGFCLGKAEIKYSKFLKKKKKSVEDSGQREKRDKHVYYNFEEMFREAGLYWANMYVGARRLS